MPKRRGAGMAAYRDKLAARNVKAKPPPQPDIVLRVKIGKMTYELSNLEDEVGWHWVRGSRRYYVCAADCSSVLVLNRAADVAFSLPR